MIPGAVPKSLAGHLTRVWQQLKHINDEDLVCRISFQINDRAHPDFLLTYKNRFAFLLAVSDARTETIEGYIQNDLFNSGSKTPPGLERADSLEYFTSNVLEQLGVKGNASIQYWVLFPYASDKSVARLSRNWQSAPCLFLGKQACRSKNLRREVHAADDRELDKQMLDRIISRFSPESTIPSDWVSGKSTVSEKVDVQQMDFLLDYNQEDALKRDLELSSEAFRAASSGNVRLLTGTAGCGKTLILLFRARLTASLDKDQRVLVLMHNKPLRADLFNRAKELGLSGNIEWRTFYSWIYTEMKKSNLGFEMIAATSRNRFIQNLLLEDQLDQQFKLDFLLKEFEWISDNGPESISLDWYIKSPRTGRKRPLKENQRKAVYSLYVRYRKMLLHEGKDDWPVAPRTFLKKLRDGKIKFSEYHTIYIDEAQFFAPVWFRCVHKALHKEYGRLFMVADPTQGFLRSGQSWTQILGGDMRGKSIRLSHPYRNTQEIMKLARRFYKSRIPSEEEEVNLPDNASISQMPNGKEPEFVKADGRSVQALIVDQVKQLIDSGLNPGHALFIDASGYSERTLIELLENHFPDRVVSASLAKGRSKLRVTTIGACTGIESPVVLLVGLDRLLEHEESFVLDAVEKEELVKKNTKKIFVALTRASQRLIVIYKNELTLEKLQGTVLEQIA